MTASTKSFNQNKTTKNERNGQTFGESKEPPVRLQTASGIPIKALYTPQDIFGLDYHRQIGLPGSPPFVRGVYPSMYRGRSWTLRQLAGFGPAEETNKRLKFLLNQGATGINTVFDYPTLRGLDSTDAIARADAGRGGVAIDTLADVQVLFDGIPSVIRDITTGSPVAPPSRKSHL